MDFPVASVVLGVLLVFLATYATLAILAARLPAAPGDLADDGERSRDP